ncbi:MAG: heme exporter protein CcmD [Gammaproteobacteria bacterium]|nr:MAG: heme exporter protein CcmD [Gammaproteobacteria bacterium]
MTTLSHFFYMSGYGGYVFSAYGCVLAFLLAQWFIPWRRWKKYWREQMNK